MLDYESMQDAAAWFGLLTAEQQDRVLRAAWVTQYPAGAMIERKGEKAYAWMGVLNGLVKVSVGNPDGKMASLTGVPAGGWIGEGSLLKSEARKYDVVALRATAIIRVPGATFSWLLDNSIP